MKHLVFTICAANYLNKAEVLFASVRKHMPDAVTALVLIERPDVLSELNLSDFADIVIPAETLEIDNFDKFVFRFDILEASTAIKPKCLLYFFKHCPGIEVIDFLDPDMEVMGDLIEPIETGLGEEGAFLLTPHHLHDEPNPEGVLINMRRSLIYGVFNLGYASFRRCAETFDVLRWWHLKLKDFGYNNPSAGFFLDQKWMDLAPGLWPGMRVLRHAGFNVANWNVARRELSRDGELTCGTGERVLLMHYSSIDDGKDVWHLRQSGDDPTLFFCLREDYLARIEASPWCSNVLREWSYARYESGQAISKLARQSFRDKSGSRSDPEPFARSNRWFISA